MKRILFGLAAGLVLVIASFTPLVLLSQHPRHPLPPELSCCQRPVDVLGNAQTLHADTDNLSGCIAKPGKPLFVPTRAHDGSVILFYVACQ